MKKSPLLILVALVIFLFSCKKENEAEVTPIKVSTTALTASNDDNIVAFISVVNDSGDTVKTELVKVGN